MLKSEMLLNILSPDTIKDLGIDKITKIKNLGNQSKYLTTIQENNPYSINQSLSYESKRIKELSKSYITKHLDKTEKTLFCSEIKFISDEQIIELLNKLEISIEDIMKINELIKDCQQANIKYTMTAIRLENKYDLKTDQALKILKLKPALLNNHYTLNQADINLYNNAQKLLILLRSVTTQKDKKLNNLNENINFKKLVFIAKDYFGINEANLFMFINKINELVVTCPEQLISNNNQKSSQKKN